MDQKYWKEMYENTTKKFEKKARFIGSVFVAFNTNIDDIKYVDENLIEFLDYKDYSTKENGKSEIRSVDDFKNGLLASMRDGKAREWIVKDMITYEWLRKKIEYDKRLIGGQAGIVANLLSRIGIGKVIVFNSMLADEEAEMYEKNVVMPIHSLGNIHLVKPKEAVNTKDSKTNLIFEFKKGMKVSTRDEMFFVPRSNRFIISYRPSGREPIFPAEFEDNFDEIFRGVKRVFLSGYQNLPNSENSFFKVKVQLAKMKKVNSELKIHFEFTSEENRKHVEKLARFVMSECDSLGCNERECEILLRGLDEEKLADDLKYSDYGVVKLCEAAKKIMAKTSVSRIQIHNLGFMVCLVKKKYGNPHQLLDALLFSSETVFTKSMKQIIKNVDDIDINLEYSISERGIDELKRFEKMTNMEKIGEGIFESGRYYFMVVPMKESKHVKTTVGLGDTISSVGFIGDLI
ncbi:MAG: hypothetical protein KAJ54_00920 [Candidatus Aenigmarchaeota archaeon]|nr:hypothetical protein [Candidatus Aenigmarchaeota archaeon]